VSKGGIICATVIIVLLGTILAQLRRPTTHGSGGITAVEGINGSLPGYRWSDPNFIIIGDSLLYTCIVDSNTYQTVITHKYRIKEFK
jgi:hypothetical protein